MRIISKEQAEKMLENGTAQYCGKDFEESIVDTEDGFFVALNDLENQETIHFKI